MKSAVVTALGAILLSTGWVAAQGPAVQIPPGQPAAAAPVLGNATVPGAACAPATPGLSAAVNGDAVDSNKSCYFSADYLLWKVRNVTIPRASTAVPVGL